MLHVTSKMKAVHTVVFTITTHVIEILYMYCHEIATVEYLSILVFYKILG